MTDISKILRCDIECYCNYLLIMFKKKSNGQVIYFEKFNDSEIDRRNILFILNKYTIVTFNGIKYDKTILEVALAGLSNSAIHKASKMMIDERMQPWEVRKQMGVSALWFDHIDLIEVAPLKGSLKVYGGRMHCPTMQDLPIEPHETIKDIDRPIQRKYCINDLDNTGLLQDTLETELKLRETMSKEYDVDVRSKSDAQIAETIISHELKTKYKIKAKRPKIKVGTKFYYKAPDNLSFQTETLQEIFELFKSEHFTVGKSGHMEIKTGLYEKDLDGNYIYAEDKKGKVKRDKKGKKIKVPIPHKLENKKFELGGLRYKVGMGGLHSIEKKVSHEAGKYILCEIDAASFYPRIIINNGLSPKHLGEPLLEIYTSIVERRLKAKRNGDKIVSNSLKIAINGSFGKFGSMWSFLFAPDLMMQVTITGQLSLLMLVESLLLAGIKVVSGNTDGIVLKMLPEQKTLVHEIVQDWEFETNYDMEYTYYSGLYSRDVNNYIAIKDNGEIKGKGVFADQLDHGNMLSKNPVNIICTEAVKLYLKDKIPIEKTIKECTDIRKFVTIRTVKGGALYEDKLVGKVIRWYYSKYELDAMYYKTSGNKVPRSDGARPLMVLPKTLPDDLDYDWYIVESYDLLKKIGFTALTK